MLLDTAVHKETQLPTFLVQVVIEMVRQEKDRLDLIAEDDDRTPISDTLFSFRLAELCDEFTHFSGLFVRGTNMHSLPNEHNGKNAACNKPER